MDLTPYIGSLLFISILPVIIFFACMIGINRKLGDIRDLLKKHNEILEKNSKATLNKDTETISDKTELDP